MQFFPKAQTLVGKHLHKAIEIPIIIHQEVADLPLSFLFRDLTLLFLDDHLPLGKIANDHSPFSQCVNDEMGGFVQIVALFVAFLFSLVEYVGHQVALEHKQSVRGPVHAIGEGSRRAPTGGAGECPAVVDGWRLYGGADVWSITEQPGRRCG
jgi:hypothetical protein